jgi:ubiquinone/menaquinone biosynthesis C-methylase UbiE
MHVNVTGKGHKRFAAFWDWAVKRENKSARDMRREVVAGAKGRVLELGVGVGANWPFLPPGIDYTGIEPDPYMVDRARRHAAEAGVDHTLLQAPAEALPFPDHDFDTVVVTLTLCTVGDLDLALAEARRVLKPGGELRCAEHGRARNRAGSLFQDLAAPVWRVWRRLQPEPPHRRRHPRGRLRRG